MLEEMSMLVLRANALILATAIVSPAFGATEIAVGPNAVVPDGAPLPESYVTHDEDACDLLGQCGVICPNAASVFIGDFAYDASTGGFVVVDVVTPDGIFRMDSGACNITDYASYAGVSQRGCGIDNDTGNVYTGSWNDQTIWQLDNDFNVLGSQNFGEPFAGIAVDEAARMLYAVINASPDQLVEYAILDDGSLEPSGNRWEVPWQAFSDGFTAAALEFDDCSSTFMSINQDANAMEYFRLEGGALVGAGSCDLPLGFGWGFGLDFANVDLKIADIGAFSCDFPVETVEPDAAICGGGDIADLTLRYNSLASFAVRGENMPFGASIRNNTDGTLNRQLWVTLNNPPLTVPLGFFDFAPGGSDLYGAGGPIPLPPGTYNATMNIGEAAGGTPDASADFSFILNRPGVQ